ncbi:MAG: putative signal transducing protein, partial [Betaproteobacteria bacterium]
MKRIFSSYNLAAVHHARNLLEAAGVRAVVKNEYLSSAMGDLPPAECQVELWLVRDIDAERAARILSLEQHSHETPWNCVACGEQAEP